MILLPDYKKKNKSKNRLKRQVFAVIYVSNFYMPDGKLPPCLEAMSPPGRQAGARCSTARYPENSYSHPTHPVLNLALPQPFCARKALLNLSGGPDAAQAEGH